MVRAFGHERMRRRAWTSESDDTTPHPSSPLPLCRHLATGQARFLFVLRSFDDGTCLFTNTNTASGNEIAPNLS
ncbi:hypothetical protein B296_00040301 [Ensete ventricosum]|uniref:Uncharacterized protein n=1 Tax=Ensete ventricosum TaxID=4639 RepID=A0A426WZN3_ENSVE|nr:hypothetical protein B296_00040301 [Ensete ventricosum]